MRTRGTVQVVTPVPPYTPMIRDCSLVGLIHSCAYSGSKNTFLNYVSAKDFLRNVSAGDPAYNFWVTEVWFYLYYWIPAIKTRQVYTEHVTGNGRFWNGCYGTGRGRRGLGRGQLNSSGHVISVAVMPQWKLEHRVFTYDSFVKSGESIIETQRLFRCRFMGTFQVAKPSWGRSHLFEQEER